MSDSNKTADLTTSGEQFVVDLINAANATSFEASDVVIGAPSVSADEKYNTDIEVTHTVTPDDGQPTPVTVEYHYHRFDLARLFANRSIEIVNNNYTTVADLLAPLATEARVVFESTDLVQANLPTGDYPRAVVLKANPMSLRFTGQFSIDLLEAKAVDDSFITEPVITPNATPSQILRSPEHGTLLANNQSAEKLFVASNGEVELFVGARLGKVDYAVGSRNDEVVLDISDQGEWNIPFGAALLKKTNSKRLTDRYAVSLKITAAQGGGVINLALTRKFGRLYLIDTANQIEQHHEEATNADQSLYTDVLYINHVKRKFGSLTLNPAGSPYGDFQIEFKAVDLADASNTLTLAFTAKVKGLAE
ncbi:hypothetical protein LUCX_277 [Xanthomonas phage vB_XciM_LucasX]|nr:hypothetical protein LUCX_277 [Xanthomonas phage vB_XciM_LucasX]